MGLKSTGGRNQNNIDTFGYATNDFSVFTSPKKKGSTNKNTLFLEEYKLNLRKINAKKASSPILKSNSNTQRFGSSTGYN